MCSLVRGARLACGGSQDPCVPTQCCATFCCALCGGAAPDFDFEEQAYVCLTSFVPSMFPNNSPKSELSKAHLSVLLCTSCFIVISFPGAWAEQYFYQTRKALASLLAATQRDLCEKNRSVIVLAMGHFT